MAENTSRTVLITGAGGGMSVGITARLAEAGHHLICADLDLAAAERAAERVRESGGRATAYELDVTDTQSVESLRERVTAEHGGVDVLVNAAGVLDRKYLKDHTADSFRTVLDINLTGPFEMIRVFSPAMVEQGWGRIVNVSSIAGVTGYPYPSYAASKAGLSNLTRSLLVDFWGTGVTVNSVCPGVVDTPMIVDATREAVKSKVPTEKIVDPAEIGGLINYLISDEAGSVNGADLRIDGGATQIFRLFDDTH